MTTASTEQPVILVHGFGDHGSALPYQRLRAALPPWPLRIVSYDHQGHGTRRTEPPPRWSSLLDDLDSRRRHLAAACGCEPALIGLSLGALLALDLAVSGRAGASAIVAGAAPVGPIGASRTAVLAARLLGRWVPALPLRPALDLTNVATNPDVVRSYVGDPLFHQDLRAGLAADIFKARSRVLTGAAGLTNRVLLLHGTEDRIAKWDGVFAGLAPPNRCSVRLFPGARHNIWLEPCVDEGAAAIAEFLIGGCRSAGVPPKSGSVAR